MSLIFCVKYEVNVEIWKRRVLYWFLKKKKLNFCLLLIMVWCIVWVGYDNILYIIDNGLIDCVWNLILLRNNCND